MKKGVATTLLWIVVGVLAMGLLAQTLRNRSHNEQMYVTAGALLAQGERLYTDFAFVQTPYAPQVYALAYRLTGTDNLLGKAKLINYGFLLLAAGALYLVLRRETHDGLFTATVMALFFANYYLLRAAIEASNYTMPLGLSLLAYAVLLYTVDGSRRWMGMLGGGLLLGLAAGAKLYYLTLLAPFALAALLYPTRVGGKSRILTGVLPLAVGALMGLLPAAFYALGDIDRFAFNNLGYHNLNALWREQNGFTDTMNWASKLNTAVDLLANPSYLLLLSWIGLAGAVLWSQRRGRVHGLAEVPVGVLLSGMLIAVSLLTAFVPRPLFPQYFAMPVPFLLTGMAACYGWAEEPARRVLRQSAVVVMVLAFVIILPRHAPALAGLFSSNPELAGRGSAAGGAEIAAQISAAGQPADATARVATLAPVYALEGGLGIYPELATGSFLLRVGDLLTPEERTRYVATSLSTLPAALDAEPPAAILVGEEGEVEMPLLEYAEAHGYREVGLIDERLRLFVR